MRRTTSLLALVVATSVLSACGSGATEAGSPTPSASSPSATLTPAPSATTSVRVPAFPAGTGPQSGENTSAWDLGVRDIRVGQHDGFDRVVVELEGTGTPGWSAEYVTTPRAEGSGEVVDVRGESTLVVFVSGVTTRQGGPRMPEVAGEIEDVEVVGAFEGYYQFFLGIDGDKAPFRVFALTGPPRLVVDVKDD